MGEGRIKTTQILSILGYSAVILIIGIPTWWITTRVYRVDLPYAEIQEDLLPPPKLPSRIIFVSSEIEEENHEFAIALKDALLSQDSDIYEMRFSSRKPSEKESSILEDFSLETSDILLSSLQERVQEGTILLFRVVSLPPRSVLIGNFRNIYLGSDVYIPSLKVAILEDILGESVLRSSKDFITLDKKSVHDKLNLRRAAASSEGYDVLFTLLVPEPTVLDAEWDIKTAVNSYVTPFTSSLTNFSSFQINSQVLYLTDLNFPKRIISASDSGGKFILSKKDLGLAINSVESQLTSHVSSNPALNFVTYIPKRAISPLYVESETTTPAFMIPKWGGVYIYNVDAKSSRLNIKMEKVMTVFMSQMRLLLGIQEEARRDGIQYLQHGGLRLWEKEFLLRLRGMENLLLSRLTLQSLAHLLSQISNIVIIDEIGEEVAKAVECFKSGASKFASGLLEEGYKDSRCSFRSSEKAFFDPSLLALLYFPEDQKYAIYIPLFLPVGLPVAVSLFVLLSFWRSSYKQKDKSD